MKSVNQLGPKAQSFLNDVRESFNNNDPDADALLVLRYFEHFVHACDEEILSIFEIDHTYPEISMLSYDDSLGRQIYVDIESNEFGADECWVSIDKHDSEMDIAMKIEVLINHLRQSINRYRKQTKSIKPGNGFDPDQQTFILMWNPAISSVTMEYHLYCIRNFDTEPFDWSVYEWEKAHEGDRFFLVRVGEGRTGIVMSGIFTSAPYVSGDWNRPRGSRQIHYMDMQPNFIVNPENMPIITTAQLQEAVPDFDWSKGHSGKLLTAAQAEKLEQLFSKYLKSVRDKMDNENLVIAD